MNHTSFKPRRVAPLMILCVLCLMSCGDGSDSHPSNDSASINMLAAPPGAVDCYPSGISDDGRTIVGSCVDENGETRGVKWIDETPSWLPFVQGPLEGLARGDWVNAVNADGTVIVGESGYDGMTPTAFYYREGAWTRIDPEDNSAFVSATSVSSDGELVVGSYVADGTYGYYLPISSPEDFYALPYIGSFWGVDCENLDNQCMSGLRAVDGSGTYLVGFERFRSVGWDATDSRVVPIRYTRMGGAPPFVLPIPAGFSQGRAEAVSRDGTAIAGTAWGNGLTHTVVLWDALLGAADLGYLHLSQNPWTPVEDTHVGGVSSDGARVVGMSGGEAFLAENGGKRRGLADVLADRGAGDGLEAWDRLDEATAVTPDGKTIIGFGSDAADDSYAGFIVHLP